MKVKIGKVIVFNSDHEIGIKGGGRALVKKGDKAQVLRKVDETTGEILYLSGEAKGKSQYVKIEVDDDIDVDEIARKLMEEL
ncbi:hypothetical protein ACER0A_013690 [Haloimpatiens sp. FM7315]|uniref:hypothetical protein n=1 Tax=Haloimpatiens sp. FM7315 TaxID=3298609 RepID=UPI0035A2C4E1